MSQKRDPYGLMMAIWDTHQYCGGCRTKSIGSDPCVLKLTCSHCSGMEKQILLRPSRPYKERKHVKKRKQEQRASQTPGQKPGTGLPRSGSDTDRTWSDTDRTGSAGHHTNRAGPGNVWPGYVNRGHRPNNTGPVPAGT